MAKPSTTLLIISLIVILVIIVVIKVVSGQNGRYPTQQPMGSFSVTGHSVSNQPLGITDQISVNFSKPVSIGLVKLTITPEVQLTYSVDNSGQTLLIQPAKTYDFGTSYQLTILKNSQSTDGRVLNRDTVIRFETGPYGGI